MFLFDKLLKSFPFDRFNVSEWFFRFCCFTFDHYNSVLSPNTIFDNIGPANFHNIFYYLFSYEMYRMIQVVTFITK